MLESSEVKMYQTILFDLDGTITDSGSGIMRSILYATEQLGLPAPSEETLRSFIERLYMSRFCTWRLQLKQRNKP